MKNLDPPGLHGPITRCRVCGHGFFAEPLLRYENMPKAAQHFPDAGSLGSDSGVDLELCQCSACGLVQLSGAPVPYYREVIRAAGFSEEMKAFRRKQLGDFAETHRLEGKKILEVGCGRGEYLSILQQSGLDAYGLEYSLESVKRCDREGLKATRGFLRSGKQTLKNGPFQAFFMFSFLEHLPDPKGTLEGICNNLADDAMGLVEVPNFDLILGKNLFSEFIGDHLLYFTAGTLATTLETNGFEILACEEVWHHYILSATVRKRRPLELSHFLEIQEHIKMELTRFVDAFDTGQVAVWGAGHQALALLSLSGLSSKIRYVIDSASFKQDKFTPATHLPIVPPEALLVDPVKAVIVMAASYSDEVARVLRQDHDPRLRVCILRDFGLETV